MADRLAAKDIGALLRAWSDGDQTALDRLAPIVYDELRRLAHRYMEGEPRGHTLQTTALVNEAYMRLVEVKRIEWRSRGHFFAAAAEAMRRILIDNARRKGRVKHGGDVERQELADHMLADQLEDKIDLLALDAKVSFDDNALYRHPDLRDLRDLGEEDPLEVEASKFSLNYIRLEGNIGCMVNGAGLAMATMDIIKLAGGEPANFLDVGGGANAEQIKNAFRILMADSNVKAVLINIFGGILRCDVLAQGVIAAVQELGVRVPIVIRMEGTNVEEGKRLLRESGLNFTTVDSMGEAADKVVSLAGGK